MVFLRPVVMRDAATRTALARPLRADPRLPAARCSRTPSFAPADQRIAGDRRRSARRGHRPAVGAAELAGTTRPLPSAARRSTPAPVVVPVIVPPARRAAPASAPGRLRGAMRHPAALRLRQGAHAAARGRRRAPGAVGARDGRPAGALRSAAAVRRRRLRARAGGHARRAASPRPTPAASRAPRSSSAKSRARSTCRA